MIYIFDTDIAEEYGTNEAILLCNLAFWTNKNAADGRNFHEGRYWTFNTIAAFSKFFPMWTPDQMRRILESIRAQGAVLTGCFNKIPQDRTLWYALSDDFIGRFGQIHLAKWPNGVGKSASPLPDGKRADDKPDNRSSSTLLNSNIEDSLSSSGESLSLVAEQGTLVNEKIGLPPDCQEIIDAWRGLPCLPRILTTAGKLKPIRAALRDPFFRANWREALSRIPKIPFLMGSKGFKANFNWFINPENVEKIMNNTFDGKATPKPKNWDRDKI